MLILNRLRDLLFNSRFGSLRYSHLPGGLSLKRWMHSVIEKNHQLISRPCQSKRRYYTVKLHSFYTKKRKKKKEREHSKKLYNLKIINLQNYLPNSYKHEYAQKNCFFLGKKNKNKAKQKKIREKDGNNQTIIKDYFTEKKKKSTMRVNSSSTTSPSSTNTTTTASAVTATLTDVKRSKTGLIAREASRQANRITGSYTPGTTVPVGSITTANPLLYVPTWGAKSERTYLRLFVGIFLLSSAGK